ncbi:MAG: hypothetical protein WBM02_00130 [bacterium]
MSLLFSTEEKGKHLEVSPRAYFGFKDGNHTVHTSRTIMLRELSQLFDLLPEDAGLKDYSRAVIDDNMLGKATLSNRKLTIRHLKSGYGLSPDIPIFRHLRRLWHINPDAQPLLALFCAIARDPLLRISSEYILCQEIGAPINSSNIEEFIQMKLLDRFNSNTLRSVSQNIGSSWTQSGHLSGKVKKVRTHPVVTPENTVYALFIAYLEGFRDNRLLSSPWAKILDWNEYEILEMVSAAARRGLVSFLRVDTIIEIRFDQWLSPAEKEWLHEQNQ